jgi:hypothetical protein
VFAGFQCSDVAIRDDFSSRLPRLSAELSIDSAKALTILGPQLLNSKQVKRFDAVVTRPQAVAIHLHSVSVHTYHMDRSITDVPLRMAAAFSLTSDRDVVHVYGETAFHYFLDIERARFIRSARPCVLLRVDMKDQHGIPARLSQTLSERLFLAIAKSVRETDFIGWYEDERVAAAVLTELAEERHDESIRRTVDRLRRRLEAHLPVAVSSRLDIRANTIRDERVWN